MSDAVEAKLTSWGSKANGEVRLSFVVHKDDAQKVDALRWMVGHDFGVAFAKMSDTGGMPNIAGEPVWHKVGSDQVGAAPSTRGPLENTQGVDSTLLKTVDEKSSAADPKPSRTLPQLIGSVCNDTRFQGFCLDRAKVRIVDPVQRIKWVSQYVRDVCRVASRSEIQLGTPAHDNWKKLWGDYLAENR